MNGSRTSNGPPRPFNLFSEPFHILCIEPGATTQQVHSAFDRALEKHSISAEALVFARDIVLDPIRRLPHELGYPIDSAPADIEVMYIALARDASLDDRLAFASRLPPLSGANFLAHVAAYQPASGALLSALVDAHASIEVPKIFDILKALRASAGYFAPSLVSVNQGLIELYQNHAQAAIARYELIQDATDSVLACTEEMLAQGGRHHIEALERFLAAYQHSVISQQSSAIEGIRNACEVLLRQPTDALSLENLKATLLAWMLICRPLILWNVHQGSDEPDFKLPVDQVRAVIAKLAGQKHHDVALNLAEFGRDVFSIMPKAAGQFEDDVDLIADLLLQTKMQPLRAFIEGLGDDLSSLARSLVKSGFGQNSAGQGGVLWNLFVQATDATVAKPSAEPWMLVRQLAIHLSHQMEHDAAPRLIQGLIAYGVQASAPPEILAMLSDDLSLVEPHTKFDPLAEPAIEKRNSHGLASILRMKPIRFALLSALALTVVLCAVGVYFGFQMLWGPSSPSTAPGPVPERSEAEIMPPVGAGQRLDLRGVRYCKFQEARLLMIKPEVHGVEDTRRFNELAGDYNSRCSDFFYRDSDFATVEAEMAQNSAQLAADAKRVVSTWPGYNFPTAK